jgi:hypothetical protein
MNDEDLFDVEVVRPSPRKPAGLALVLLGERSSDEPWKIHGLIGVELPLRDAQELTKSLKNAGGGALVLPRRYRGATLTRAAAREIARRRLDLIKSEQGDVFGPLEDGYEEWMWWGFYADHLPSQEEGREPGCIFINVDKLDGHVQDEDDVAEYRRWQSGG